MKARKRLLALMLVMLMLFSLLPAYAAAEPGVSEAGEAVNTDDGAPPACAHTPGEAVTENEVAPTCTVPGSHDEAVYCSVCGEELSRETVTDPAPGHQPEDVDEVPAEIGLPGMTAGKKCSVCGEILEGCGEIPALPAEAAGKEALVTIKSQPKNAAPKEGAAEFSVEAEADAGAELQYQWQQLDDSEKYEDETAREAAWADIEGETGSAFRLTGPEALKAALPLRYRCVVTAGEACVTTDEVFLSPEEKTLDSTMITGFAELPENVYEWERKPTLDNLRSALPEELDVLLGGTGLFAEDAEGRPLLLAVRDAEEHTLPVVWTCVQDYDEDLEVFDLFPAAEGYTLADGLRAPLLQAHVDELYVGPLGGDLPGGLSTVPIVGDGAQKRGMQKRGMSNDKYNAYELGLLPPIRDQGSEGACWAFAALGAMETDMIHDGIAAGNDLVYGLSESNLAYYLTNDLPSGALRNGPLGDRKDFSGNFLDHGGNAYVATVILENGVGAVWEQEGDYSPSYTPSGDENQAVQLTGAYFIDPEDTAGIKAAIRAHGGVYSSMYFTSSHYSSTYNSYYCSSARVNHGVMLVGWDDSFPGTNFKADEGSLPGRDGAWLVRNSWGGNGSDAKNDYGSAGYFWMSYEDLSWRSHTLTAFDVGRDVYRYCYAYDSLPFPSDNEVLDADVPMSVHFTAVGNEAVTAVGFFADCANLHGTATVSSGGASRSAEVWTSFAGYYLFTLSEPVNVSPGADVTVTLCFDTPAEISYEASGTFRYGAVSLYPQLDGAGYTVDSGVNAVTKPNDPRIKLYTRDSPAGNPTAVTKVKLSGDDLVTVDEANSSYRLSLNSGESEQLTAIVLPADAASRTITWSSSDPKIAKVDGGLVMSVSPGTAVITAAAHNGVKAACTVTVAGKSVESVTLNRIKPVNGQKVHEFNEQSLSAIPDRDDLDLTRDVIARFSYEVLPKDALNKDVVWSSSNPAVFEVDANTGEGRYRGIGEATLTVTARDESKGKKSDSVLIKVTFTPCTITYDARDGKPAPAEQSKCPYIPIRLSTAVPTKAGYRFLGWATSDAAGASAAYQPGDLFKENKSTTLYAVWGPNVRLDGLNGQRTVSIDGVSYPVGEDGSVFVPPGSKIIEAYTFRNDDSEDPHLRYPIDLKVWRVSEGKEGTTVERLEELDNILQYSGFSIRISGNPGIRMITSVPTNMKTALTSGGLAGYTLEEDGALVAWADSVGESDMTLSSPGVRSNHAYKRGVSDPVFNTVGNLTQYTNVLVDFNYNQVPRDLAMRSYMILSDSSGQRIVLYGGTVHRSIGYVAYQNRSAFKPGTAAYEYVWKLIHVTYGSRYDSEYRK